MVPGERIAPRVHITSACLWRRERGSLNEAPGLTTEARLGGRVLLLKRIVNKEPQLTRYARLLSAVPTRFKTEIGNSSGDIVQ